MQNSCKSLLDLSKLHLAQLQTTLVMECAPPLRRARVKLSNANQL